MSHVHILGASLCTDMLQVLPPAAVEPERVSPCWWGSWDGKQAPHSGDSTSHWSIWKHRIKEWPET